MSTSLPRDSSLGLKFSSQKLFPTQLKLRIAASRSKLLPDRTQVLVANERRRRWHFSRVSQ